MLYLARSFAAELRAPRPASHRAPLHGLRGGRRARRHRRPHRRLEPGRSHPGHRREGGGAVAACRRGAGCAQESRPRCGTSWVVLDAAVGRLTLSMDGSSATAISWRGCPRACSSSGPRPPSYPLTPTASASRAVPRDLPGRAHPVGDRGPPLSAGNDPLGPPSSRTSGRARSRSRNRGAHRHGQGHALLLEITAQGARLGDGAATAQVLVVRRCLRKSGASASRSRRADQLAFLGGMAARIAHEIRRLSPPSAGFSSCSRQTCPRAITAASTSTGCSSRGPPESPRGNLLTAGPAGARHVAGHVVAGNARGAGCGCCARSPAAPGAGGLRRDAASVGRPVPPGRGFHQPHPRTRWRPAPEGGTVRVRVDRAEVTMSACSSGNSGAGIPAELH